MLVTKAEHVGVNYTWPLGKIKQSLEVFNHDIIADIELIPAFGSNVMLHHRRLLRLQHTINGRSGTLGLGIFSSHAIKHKTDD